MVNAVCADSIIALAWVGGLALYLLFGYVIALIFKEIFEDKVHSEDLNGLICLCGLLWPFAICAGLLYLIGSWITVGIWAASRDDLRRVDNRLSREIERGCSTPIDFSDDVEYVPSFRVGDIITGTIPQTDAHGENMSYKHLYHGCKCRVLSIHSNDSMKVILIDHKDRDAHENVLGETFTVPARNFMKVKRSHQKKGTVSRARASRAKARR